jgi:uncharacterized integral membrane protein
MALTDFAGQAMERVAGRLGRRAAGWLLVVIFALAAIYQLATAMSVALELEFGLVQAHLIMGALCIVAASIIMMILSATARRWLAYMQHADRSPKQIELQVATIVEAVLLGYSLSRRK